MSEYSQGGRDWVPDRVLAIYAHPDDPEVSCAGTLIRWARAGCAVHLVICTKGEKGTHDPDVDPGELADIRAREADEAASVMGLTGHEILGFPDGELDNTVELRALLVERIRAIRPDVVICPDPTAVLFGASYVNHHDHREVGFAVLDSCAPAAASPLYFPDSGPAHRVPGIYLSGTLQPDTWIDISSSIEAKVAALLCHRSQVGDDHDMVGDVVRQRAASAGAEVGIELAEGFRVLDLA